MKLRSTLLLVFCCWMMLGLGLQAQSNASSAEGGKTAVASEMPPALQNMQGSPGYEQEHQKWLQSQNHDAGQAQAQANKNVKSLQAAQWTAPPTTNKVSQSSEGTPYHQYKGIADPAEAKKAWTQDQKSSGK